MKIKKSIFDSNPEIKIHQNLSKLWGDKVLILPHIPVKDVIDIYDKNANISSDEKEKLLVKSNFDFVVASKKKHDYGRPLLVIEFDGIGCGFSFDRVYKQVKSVESDKYRKLKMDCKIRICEEAELPLIVLSWEEIESFFEEEEIGIIDGIIGQVIWNDEFNRVMEENLEKFEENIEGIDDVETKYDMFSSFATSCEVEAACNVNPIVNLCAKLNSKVHVENLVGVNGFKPIVEGDLIGYEWYAYLNDGKETYLSKKVLVRNINCSKANSGNVALDVAEMLLWKKVIEINEHSKKSL